jgi:excisionase family DNA binding protein
VRTLPAQIVRPDESSGIELFGVRKSTAARLLDCSRWTIDRLIADGELEAFMLRGKPRVRVDSIRRLVEHRRLEAS